MSHKLVEPTALAVAAAELQAADAELANIEAANEPTEAKLAALIEHYDAKGHSATAELRSKIATLVEKVRPGRQRLDAAKQRRARLAERLESENRAIAIAREGVRQQQARVTRQREVLAAAQKVVTEKGEGLAREQAMLGHFERELSKLISPEEER